jgi:hypothetical protein
VGDSGRDGLETGAGGPSSGARGPGLREVLLIAVAVLAVVFAIEFLTSRITALGQLFGDFPVTILVLVVGTIAVLVAILRGSRA